MKTNYLLSVMLFLGFYLLLSCEKEEDKMPSACFEPSKTTANLGDIISFSNCSSDATHYGWDFGDGNKTNEISPSHTYESPGSYSVTLTAYNKDKANQFVVTITIDDETTSFDPRDYSSSPTNGWVKYYGNDFSESGEWLEETTEDYVTEISGGYYSIENLTEEYSWSFFAGEVMLSSTENYDIDVFCNLVYDNVTSGVGLVWAYDLTNSEYYYFRYTDYENQIWSIIGNSIDGSWLPDEGWGLLGGKYDENLLTVRKYDGNYYFFINQVFVFEHSYGGDYGDKFGFFVGASSKMTVNEITIHNMSFGSGKSASSKTYNSTTKTNSVGGNIKSKLGSRKID